MLARGLQSAGALEPPPHGDPALGGLLLTHSRDGYIQKIPLYRAVEIVAVDVHHAPVWHHNILPPSARMAVRDATWRIAPPCLCAHG